MLGQVLHFQIIPLPRVLAWALQHQTQILQPLELELVHRTILPLLELPLERRTNFQTKLREREQQPDPGIPYCQPYNPPTSILQTIYFHIVAYR